MGLRSRISVLLTVCLLLSTIPALAETQYSGYYDYTGTIGTAKVAMSLYFDDESTQVKGSYFYDKYRNLIALTGKKTSTALTLNEYDSKKKLVGTFSGKINKDDSYTGYWKNAKTGKKTAFKLSLVSALPFAEYNHRYGVIGIENDKDVDAFVLALQKSVISEDKVALSQMVSYPITCYNDVKPITIETPEDFVKNYSIIMTPTLKKDLSTAYTQYLFANSEGLMFGSNIHNVWIAALLNAEGKVELKVISFNQ